MDRLYGYPPVKIINLQKQDNFFKTKHKFFPTDLSKQRSEEITRKTEEKNKKKEKKKKGKKKQKKKEKRKERRQKKDEIIDKKKTRKKKQKKKKEKIGRQCVLGVLCLNLFLLVGMLFSHISVWKLNCYKRKGRQVITTSKWKRYGRILLTCFISNNN